MQSWALAGVTSTVLFLVALPTSISASALSVSLLDPADLANAVPVGAEYAREVLTYEPQTPGGDVDQDGSAALFAPNDIGFFPEPDGHLSAALGHGGVIEVAFQSSVVRNGRRAAPGSIAGAEILIYEDGALDGARFYGRRRSDQRLVLLGSLEHVISTEPSIPGAGPDGRDTLIAIDLDALDSGVDDLVAIRIVDDGMTGSSKTFEVDAVVNLSPGEETSPLQVSESGTLLVLGLGGLALGRRPWRIH